MSNKNPAERKMTRRDIWLRMAAGVIGAMVALLPSQYHPAPPGTWLSTYEAVGKAIWMPPWSLLSLPALGLFLYLTRFHRGNVGLALGAGAALVMSIRNMQ